MSKKTKRKAQERETRKREIKDTMNAQPTRSSSGTSRAYDRGARGQAVSPRNVLILRIVALLIAVTALAGGIYWAQRMGDSFNPGVIIGLLALGVISGLAFFTAMRPQVVIQRYQAVARR